MIAAPVPEAATPAVSILDVMTEPSLLGDHFNGDTFRAWRVLLAALFALDPPTEDALALFQQCTGRTSWPSARYRELVLVCGRRSGKTFICALLVIFVSLFGRFRLPPGTVPVVMAIAADRLQARVLMKYIRGLLEQVPVLLAQVEKFNKESIEFRNGVVVQVATSSHRTVRGYTCVACVADEISFWRGNSDTAAVSDREVLDAIRPAQATIDNALLLVISSPYRQQGELWRLHQKHFGKDNSSRVLVWQADTKTMNPSVPDDVIAAAYDEDPAAAASEYGAQWRTDLADFISEALLRASVDPGIASRPYVQGTRYVAFVDAAGGSGTDSMTLGIGHSEFVNGRQVHVLDALLERRPPFSPDNVVSEFAHMCRNYQIKSVTGDHWGGGFVREPFTRLGVGYSLTKMDRSALYLATLPLLTSGRAKLLDHERMIRQFVALERRTGLGGNDRVDHPRGGSDDVSNAAAGVLAHLELHPSRGPICAFVRVEALL